MVCRRIVFILALFFVLVNFGFVSALNANFTLRSSYYINVSENSLVNVTIGAISVNITQVTFNIDGGFVNGTNGTSASNVNFANTSSGPMTAIFSNTSAVGIINNGSSQSFWFGINDLGLGDLQVRINATGIDGTTNASIQVVVVNFPFSGYVKNETGSYQNATNVTVYQFIMSQNGPPTETEIASVLTNANGSFSFASINGSGSNYLLKLVHYNASGVATKTGSVLPAFPAGLYYPTGGDLMGDMSLNGSTFYLQPAATLRLYAHNTTTNMTFGYEIIDQRVGFPVKSNMQANVSTADVIVPSGRDYGVMIMTENAPPVSNGSLGTISAGSVVVINQSVLVNDYNLYGCINIATGHNNTAKLNVTNIKLKLSPFSTSSGMFIPPINAGSGINLSDIVQLNHSNPGCSGLAWYNISVLGSASGMNYLLEIYAKNASSENVNPGSNANKLAGFQNITIRNNTNLNLTLYKLAGEYWADGLGSVNTSTMRINIQNETGDSVTTSMHIEVGIKNSNAGIGTIHYMIEDIANGTFYLPILNNSNWIRVAVFPNDAPPMEKTLNLSLSENNITLVSIDFSGGGDKGLREMNSSGELVEINSSAMPFQIRFLRRGTDEVITSMSANDFNPLKALVAGEVDLELRVTATNVTMKFHNFDMFSAKQPPMFAVMDNSTLNSSSSQNWKFGNFVPSNVYDNVTLIIPYNETLVNESYNYNMSVPVLYQERANRNHQFEVAWNVSAGYTSANLSDEFIEYNDSRYRDYLTSGGTACSKTSISAVCFMNTSANTISMEIPHFSGLSPRASGTAPASGDNGGSSSSSSGGGGSSSAGTYWTNTYTVGENDFKKGHTRALAVKERMRISINNETHYIGVVGLTDNSAIINVSSTPQTATLKVGETKKFDVSDDEYYDLQVILNNIEKSKANLTISEISGEKVEEPESVLGDENAVAGISEGDSTFVWAIVGIVVLIVAFLFFLRKKRYY